MDMNLEDTCLGALLMVASAAGDGSSQQKFINPTPSRMYNVDQSNECGEGEQLSELL